MSRAFMVKQAPFKPTDLGGCQLWLDASDSTTISLTGSTVTQINDKSGNSNNTSSSTGTVTYTADGLNGRPAFSFNATGGFRGPTSITGTTLTAFTVATLNSGVNFNGRLFGLANATQSDYQYATTCQPFFCLNGGPNISGYRNNTYMSYQTNTFDTPFIGTSQFTGSSNSTSVNGTPGTAAADTNGSFSITKYGFGCEGLSDAGVNWYGYCSEMILYNRLLSDSERQQVEAYLAQKWGLKATLPQGHPGTRGIVYPQLPLPNASALPYPAAFLPTQIQSGTCQLWLDAQDIFGNGTAPSNGATVSTWTDKSGKGYNAVTYGAAPSYVSNKSLQFTGPSNINMRSPVPAQTFTTGMTLFVVFVKTTGANTYETLVTRTVANSPAPFDMYNTNRIWGADNNYISGTAPSFTTYTTQTLLSITMSTSLNWLEYINGTNTVSYNTTNFNNGSYGTPTWNDTASYIYIGTRADSVTRFTGQISEILAYTSTLSTLDRQKVEGYLAWKWGLQSSLDASNPYKNAAPTVPNALGISRPAGLPIPPIACYPTDKFINPNPIITTGLTNRWFFNEGTGTTFADSVGGQTGTLYGNPRWIFVNERKGIYLANTTPGNNSATQYGTTTGGQPASVFATINWSLTVWMYPLTYLIEGADVFFGVGNYMDMYVGTASGQLAMYCNLTPSYGLAAAGTGVQKNVWSQITITCLNGAVTSYINGTLTTTGTYTTQTYVSSSISYIGAYQNTAFGVNMYLSDMRVYNRALTQTEINQICANTG